MPRKDKWDDKWFEDEIAKCFIDGATTIEERNRIAVEWCMGNYSYVKVFCESRPLLPIALLVGALLEVEHPLLVTASRMRYASFTVCQIEVLKVELFQIPVSIPMIVPCVQVPISL